jgi:hypothetical protein
MIIRTWAGRTVVSNIHNYANAKWTKAQVANRDHFRLAVKWAKSVLSNEKVYRYYKKKAKGAQTAYNVAIGDYMKHLKLQSDFSRYGGAEGGRIRFSLDSIFGASSVKVSLKSKGHEVESGLAKATDNGHAWVYDVKKTDPAKLPSRVSVTLFRGPVPYTCDFFIS